jgi:hypothetical protein
MLHCGKAPPRNGVGTAATPTVARGISNGKVLAPRPFLGFNLNKIG